MKNRKGRWWKRFCGFREWEQHNGPIPDRKMVSFLDVYGDNTNIIPEEIPELISYMGEVMPKKRCKVLIRKLRGRKCQIR